MPRASARLAPHRTRAQGGKETGGVSDKSPAAAAAIDEVSFLWFWFFLRLLNAIFTLFFVVAGGGGACGCLVQRWSGCTRTGFMGDRACLQVLDPRAMPETTILHVSSPPTGLHASQRQPKGSAARTKSDDIRQRLAALHALPADVVRPSIGRGSGSCRVPSVHYRRFVSVFPMQHGSTSTQKTTKSHTTACQSGVGWL